jgi:hypothetical protein
MIYWNSLTGDYWIGNMCSSKITPDGNIKSLGSLGKNYYLNYSDYTYYKKVITTKQVLDNSNTTGNSTKKVYKNINVIGSQKVNQNEALKVQIINDCKLNLFRVCLIK